MRRHSQHRHFPPHRRPRGPRRFFPFAFFFFSAILLFVGGSAAGLYLLFSEYSGVTNIWLLFCFAPVIVVFLLIFTIVNLYIRFGRPLEQIFNAIDSVAEGNLAVRVPEDRRDMFSELIKRFNKMISELERADQQRRNLTADVAHELRTPLHIIQGNLEGVLDGVYQPTPDHINNTLDETKLLARLVDDLQTLSLAESGELPLHSARFALADLIDDLALSFSSQAASKGIDLATSVVNTAVEMNADYDRLNQALTNLVSNAIRHTPRGGKISIETELSSSAERRARIIVRDSGEGIASENLPFIFDRFWRADRSRTDREHSGLGLAITKQIVHAHGGTIDVESQIGQGTTFTILLPCL